MTGTPEERTALFWRLVEPRLDDGELERGTLMGHPCVRKDGDFVAMPEARTGALVVKLTEPRATQLIDEGTGRPFAPAGRVFSAWVRVPEADEELWDRLIEEAR